MRFVERLPRLRSFLRIVRRNERGQSLVEFALLAPILFGVIFGGIDLGFVFKDYIGVRQGVSDAARQAAVANFGSTTSCGLVGAGGNATTQKLMCLVHSLDGIGDTGRTRVAIFVGDSSHKDKYLGPSDSGGGPQPITICEQYHLHSVTGITSLFINNTVATSTATDMIEVSGTAASSAPISGAETSLKPSAPNQGWPTVCTSGPAPAGGP
jgi:TadE-like protein